MKIYFCHSKELDFKRELYLPIRESELNEKYEFIFPHEGEDAVNSREIIKTSDVVFSEVSFPATGLGIELGWASMLGKQIVCFYRSGSHVSGSLKFVSQEFVEYRDIEDLKKKITEKLEFLSVQ